ncbi:MAG: hypothetical protein V7L11_22740 [Nostoc sp.]
MKTRSGGNPDISLARLIELSALPIAAIAFLLKAQLVRQTAN